jgi:hypothetical protein
MGIQVARERRPMLSAADERRAIKSPRCGAIKALGKFGRAKLLLSRCEV